MTAPIKGDTSLGEQIELGLVKGSDATFNGTFVSLPPGDRWRICTCERENDTGKGRLAMSGN